MSTKNIFIGVIIILLYVYLKKTIYESFAFISQEEEEGENYADNFRDMARKAGPVVYTNLYVNKPAAVEPPKEVWETMGEQVNLSRAQFLPYFQ